MLFSRIQARVSNMGRQIIRPLYAVSSRSLGTNNGTFAHRQFQVVNSRLQLRVCQYGSSISYLPISRTMSQRILPCSIQLSHSHSTLTTRWYTAVPRLKLDQNSTYSQGSGLPDQTKDQQQLKDPCASSPSGESPETPDPKLPEEKDEDNQPKGIIARFKDTYKNYGKALIAVHFITSPIWFSSFYYAAYVGIDVVPIMEYLGLSEKYISQAQNAGVGANLAVAYLLYKLATPARYTVTIAGTRYTVRKLRALGYMDPVPEGSTIRELVRDSKVQVKEKYEDLKIDMRDKKDEMKDRYEVKKEEMKDRYEVRKEEVISKLTKKKE